MFCDVVPVTALACLRNFDCFTNGVQMLKRAARLAKASQGRRHEPPASSSNTASIDRTQRLNLRESPLMRWAAKRVSRGAEASMVGELANAAMQEVKEHGGFSKRSFDAAIMNPL